MSKAPVAKQSGALTRLEVEIAEEVLRLRESASASLQHAKKIGDLLLKAKEHVPHGDWGEWVERLDISERSARRYMQIAVGWHVIKTATMADLTLDGAAKLLTRAALSVAKAPNESVPEPEPEKETSDAPERPSASPQPIRGDNAHPRGQAAGRARPTGVTPSGGDDGASDSSPEPGSDEDVIHPRQEAVRSAIARLVAATGKWQAAFHEAWSAVAGIPEYGPLFVKQLGAPIAKSGLGQEKHGGLADAKVQTHLVVMDEIADRISRLAPDHRCEGCGGNGCGKCRGLGFVIRGDAAQEARR